MSAPTFVPQDPTAPLRYYESPPRRPLPWRPDRTAELVGDEQPRGGLFGNQGPDIGYAYKLFARLADRVVLAAGEDLDDARLGIIAVAMRRASLFGRAPVLADLEIGATVWGFLDAQPPADLVALRRGYFEAASGHHGYHLVRSIAASVPDSVLGQTPDAIATAARADWSSVLEPVELGH